VTFLFDVGDEAGKWHLPPKFGLSVWDTTGFESDFTRNIDCFANAGIVLLTISVADPDALEGLDKV
jgi:hypothetical protein